MAAFAKQEQSPFKASRFRSPSDRNNTTGIHSPDRQRTPDDLNMSGIVCTASSNSPPAVADRGIYSAKEWVAQQDRVVNMAIRLLQWKYEFNEGDLQGLLSGTSTADTAGEQAIKTILLSIGEKYSDLVEYQMDKLSMSDRLQRESSKLNDYIQRGREAQGYNQSRDDASSTTSESTMVSAVELARVVNQQLDELDRALDILIDMGIPQLLKESNYRRRSRQRKNSAKMSPLYRSWSSALPAYRGDLSTPVIPIPVHPLQRPEPNPILNFRDQPATYSRKRRKTKGPDQWASIQEILERLRLYWRHTRPAPDLEHQLHRNKSSSTTILISSDPTLFQADKLRESLASFEQSQREPTNSLPTLFSNLRIQPVDNKLCADIVQAFRGVVPKLHHELNFETPDLFLASVESIDFTITLLDNLPNWLLYNNFAHGEELAKVFGVSIQTVLLDEFWDSCANLLSQVRETFSSLDPDTESQRAKQRYVQNLLRQRTKHLESLRVNRALIKIWSSLKPMVHQLVSRLQDCTTMPKFETETEKQPASPPIPPSPTVFHRLQTPPPLTMPVQPSPERDSTLIPHHEESQGYLEQCPIFPISHPHSPRNVVPSVKVPSPVRLPPAYLLFYAAPTPENDLSRSTSPPQRRSTAGASSVGEEETNVVTSLSVVQLSDEFKFY
ncbi:hypothetical protein F4825DRAFT_159351 [Nemania diffusa]|nr:hypothetical protein F4825DRAFT_159351 [Nemania diffusa]